MSGITFGQATPPSKPFLVGGDISMLPQIEQAGGVFRDGGKEKELIALMVAHGHNCFRLRIFVNPDHKDDGVVNDLPYTIALAKRIKATGAVFLLDFHYSDTWADPGKQGKPAAWAKLDFDSLEKSVTDYTRQVIAELKAAGATPDMVQIGNEITPGMLWPDGKLQGDQPEQWQRLGRLLKAGVAGVRLAVTEQDQVRIMIHIDRGGSADATRWFFDHLNRQNVTYDIIGLSYYPFWHSSMDSLKANLRQTAQRFGKDVMVVETAYPWRDAAGWSKKPNMAWPVSAEGQNQFLADLTAAVRATPEGRGLGVIYWYPEAIPVKGLRVWNGGATALFDDKGNVLTGIDGLGRATQ